MKNMIKFVEYKKCYKCQSKLKSIYKYCTSCEKSLKVGNIKLFIFQDNQVSQDKRGTI